MKNILLVFALLAWSSFSFAQIIDIPDVSFKDALVNTFCVDDEKNGLGIAEKDADENNDGEIDVNEAALVKHLLIKGRFIFNLKGIEYFDSLKTLDCSRNHIDSISLKDLPQLTKLNCEGNQCKSLILSNLPNLTNLTYSSNQLTNLSLSNLLQLSSIGSLNISPNSLTSLTLSNLPNLTSLDCSNNKLTSLKLSNLPNLESLDCSKNNLTSLSLNNFTKLLKISCWSNEISTLSFSDIPQLKELWCQNNHITTLDLINPLTLEILDCSFNQLTALPFASFPQIRKLYANNNDITSISFDKLVQLEELDISSNNFNTLSLPSLPNLKFLYFSSNKITTLTLPALPQLERLGCGSNQLTTLSISNYPNLVHLSCNGNQISSISLNNLPKLTDLFCGGNKLETLSLNIISQLRYLNIENNLLPTLSLSNLPNLKFFYCGNNQLTNLSLTNLSQLSLLDCSNNKLINLTLIQLPQLKELYCKQNPFNTLNISDLSLTKLAVVNFYSEQSQLKYLIAKNIPSTYFSSYNLPSSLEYICADDININKFKSYHPQVEVNSYCTFTPGGKYYSLFGKNKFDFSSNGCDDHDLFNQNFKYKISQGTISGSIISNEDGSYFIPVQEGTHTVKPILEYPEYYNVSPDSIIVTFPSTSDTIIQDFCITPKSIYRQVDLSIIPLTPPARPGFDASYKVVMTNKGNQAENGTLYFAYDEAKIDFVSTDVNPSAQSDGLLSWDFTDLAPFETRYYNVTLNVNSPSENPSVNAGDELLITCNILDNVFLLKQEVVGSYDPNDKTCLEGKTITPEQVGEYVHYLIRFENTGNYAAENVVVKDVIDESTFDISTLQITDASHEAWARINGNVVEFIFENIQLPFDDATNDGYICFKIKTKPTLVLGNELKNQANIYFDYNLPILTNKTKTVVANLVGIDEALGESDIDIFPNPVNDILKFTGDDKILKVEIFDMSGRLVQVSSVVNGEVNVERLISGAYLLKVYAQLGIMKGKIMKI